MSIARALMMSSLLQSPLYISGCALWLDAADASSITLVSSKVSQWNDKSGNARHVTQGTAGLRPTNTNTLNSKGLVTFDGSTTYLENASAALLRAKAGWTLFSVTKAVSTSPAAAAVHFCVGDVAGNSRANLQETTSGFSAIRGRRQAADSSVGATDSSVVSTSTFVRLCGVGDYTNTMATLYRNGAQAAQNASWLTSGNSDNDGGELAIGAVRNAGSLVNYWGGDIAEILIYESVLGIANLQRVDAYLKNKWGL